MKLNSLGGFELRRGFYTVNHDERFLLFRFRRVLRLHYAGAEHHGLFFEQL